MRCCHLNEREYRDLVMNSLWCSPVQDQSSGNASLLQWGEGSLILNYTIDGCVAIISLSLLSGLADFSSMLGRALDRLLLEKPFIAELVIYLLNEQDAFLFNGAIYKFEKLGSLPGGIRGSDDECNDLYIYGCSVEAQIPQCLSNIDYESATFPMLLARLLPARYEDGQAISYREKGETHSVSYSDLPGVILAAMRCLDLSARHGEIIAILGENTPFWLVACLAVLCSGNTLLPVDGLHIDTAMLTRCSVVLCDDSLSANKIAEMVPRVRVVLYDEACRASVEKPADSDFDTAKVNPGDVAVIASTSGTSGEGKWVLLTHENILASISHTMLAIDGALQPQKETLFPCMPPFHVYSIVCGLLLPLLYGSNLDYGALDVPSVPSRFLAVDPSILIAVPTTLKSFTRLLAGRGGGSTTRRLKFAAVGGAPVDCELIDLTGQLGVTLLSGYGLTECTVLAYAEIFADGERAPFKTLADSVFCHVREVDGVIEVYGRAVAKGYFEGDEFKGHFVTSDLGCLKNGRLRVSGRADSLIVLDNGGKIAPEAVESQLSVFPSIGEVRIIGVREGSRSVICAEIEVSDGFDREAVISDVGKYNQKVTTQERVMKIEWMRGGTLTRTALGKLKRSPLNEGR